MRTSPRPVLLLACLALLVAACGSPSEDAAGAAGDVAASEAPEPTEDVGEDDVDGTDPEEAPPADEPQDDDEAEAVDADPQRAEELFGQAFQAMATVVSAETRFTIETETPAGLVTIVGDGVQAGADVESTIKFIGAAAGEMNGQTVDVIVVDGTVYQRFPGMAESLGVEQEWLSFDSEELGPAFEQVVSSAEAADPGAALQGLVNAGSIEIAGTEEINGVPTTRLLVGVTLREALVAQGLDESAVDPRVDLDEVVGYSLWLDEDARLRRLFVAMTVDGADLRMTIDTVRYDFEPEIAPPPAEDTVSFADVVAGAGG